MHFQIIFFTVKSMTSITAKVFDTGVSFQMLAEVADLAKGRFAAEVSTAVGFLFCVCHQMTKEFCYAMNNFFAGSFALFVFKATFENFVLFL